MPQGQSLRDPWQAEISADVIEEQKAGFPEDPLILEVIRQAGLSEEAEEAIFRGNAVRLLGS